MKYDKSVSLQQGCDNYCADASNHIKKALFLKRENLLFLIKFLYAVAVVHTLYR